MRRRLGIAAALVAAALIGSVVTLSVVGGPVATAAPGPLPTATATVVRTDLSQTQLAQGTLDYAPTQPVVDRLEGTYTALPDPGATVAAGRTLYRVDDVPVVLLVGTTPAWRPFGPGMTDGRDVTELQANLEALGFAHGLFGTASGHFDDVTAQAVERWQTALGVPATGQVGLGQLAFLPAAIRVGALHVALGDPATPGSAPFVGTTTARVVSVPLTADLPAVQVGEAVTIVLPDQRTTPGTVSAVGPPPPGSSIGSGQSGDSSSSQPPVTAVATITPDRPADTGTGTGIGVQVSLTIQSVHGVLAVPIPALLALAGGGYGLEVVTPSGAHRLVGVTTGVFTGSRVEVTGGGIGVGTKVVVAQ